ncbi:BQ5605_C004g03040 [Microbotryum silenes-dioicae]|uniref:BQ5605_C004g03040 protein n=1 Tax=Microbotryum silenes-dioicae TaxID=796604 RepID=A0A2X0M9M5_9BASI|nr:BQ5605_C004g03040 [Microbotryum silenes-dioicae]
MKEELSAVSNFLSDFFPPQEERPSFASNLAATLAQRFDGHWHVHDSELGSGYRALVRTPTSIDASIIQAAEQSGLCWSDVERALASGQGKIWLGQRWTLWVDPGCVSVRVERGDGSSSRDSQLIEIWGKLPERLRPQALQLAKLDSGARSFNITTPELEAVQLPSPSSSLPTPEQISSPFSPTKRSSKAIQIVPPPGRRVVSLESMPSSSVSAAPCSPAVRAVSSKNGPLALLASPFIIPPTPIRPMLSNEADVFSPTPALRAPSRASSPLASESDFSCLSPSGLGAKLYQRRSSSISSSVSSYRSMGESSDSEGSTSDGIFSSTESVSSSLLSSGEEAKSWGALSTSPTETCEFKYPTLPHRSSSTSPFIFPAAPVHARSRSSNSVHTLAVPSSPSKSSSRSAPSSPSKPRRRGTRGGSGSGHGHSSSISSVTSVGSNQSAHSNVTSTSTASTSRTREQALAGTLTEHSGGKVGVLGGGVLLGLAGGSKSTSRSNDGSTLGDGKRRSRERRRGGGQSRKGSFSAGAPGSGAVAPAGLSYLLGAAAPFVSAPVWA